MDDSVEGFYRPELTMEEKNQALQLVLKFMALRNPFKERGYILVLVYENMRLFKEVNELRHALGLDPLPAMDNSKARIA
jgi:hypothetical protein